MTSSENKIETVHVLSSSIENRNMKTLELFYDRIHTCNV